MVRDRTYEASTANTTAIASGRNSAAAGPLKKNIGTNTIEMEIVETKAGVAICAAPSMIACKISFPSSMLRLMFSMVTVASSTRMPTASASPPRVITLSVSPSAARHTIEHSTASGIEVAIDRKSTRLNSSHGYISYAVFCLKKKKKIQTQETHVRVRSNQEIAD